MLALNMHESPLVKFSFSGLFTGQQRVTENCLPRVPADARGASRWSRARHASNPAYWA